MFRHNWKIEMTPAQRIWGPVFFLLYLFVFPGVNLFLQHWLFGDAEPLVAEVNLVCYILFLALLLMAFWSFLKQDLSGLAEWLPENLVSMGMGLLGAGGTYLLLGLLPFPVENHIALQYAQEFRVAPLPTLVLILVLIPVVEEIVYRGILYGRLRAYNRPLAAVVCIPLYALALVWRYALDFSDPRYLLLALLYLPMSCALTLCYERGGSVWGTALLHAGLNGATLMFAL